MKQARTSEDDQSTLKQGAKILKDYIIDSKWRYLGGFAVILAMNVLAILTPILTGRIVDELKAALDGMQDMGMRRLALFCSVFVLIAVVSLAANFFARLLFIGASNALDYLLRKKMFNKLLDLSMKFYNRFSTGDIMALATNDLPALYRALGMGAMMLGNTLILIVISVTYVMTRVDGSFAFLLFLPFPFMILIMVKFGKLIHHRFLKVQETFGDLSAKTEENISGIRVVKSFVQEDMETKNFKEINETNYTATLKLARVQALFHPTIMVLSNLPYLVILLFGGFQVMEGRISLGDYVAVNSFIGMIVRPMAFIGMIINFVQRGKVSLLRVSRLLFAKSDIFDGKFGKTLDIGNTRFQGKIEFRNLSFSYANGGNEILRDVSFTIEPGETVALLGTVGSGKSTIASLLTRTWDLEDKGMIFIDGMDITEIPLEVLRENIGYVPQNNILFSETIRYNIGFSPREFTDGEIEDAARISAVYDNIMEFPRQFDTVLGEKGVNISGGQKQRLCIARAIIKDSPIVIMDDSLSSVDVETEKEILWNMKNVQKDRTCIIIAHRISTIRDADRILLFDGGRLVETGTHEELMETGGLYHKMYNLQLIEEMEE
ncbi:MAG: ABC transporter ATP-binding protein [Clostridia bacterium]